MAQLGECCSPVLRTSSKLTVLTVYKMIQKRSAQQCSMATPQDQPECFLLRTSDKQRVPSALMRISSNGKQRCRTQAEASQSRNASGKKIFSISSKSTADPPSDINRLIIDKLRRAVKKEQKKRDRQPKLSDFGLNITQIKRLELPSRKDCCQVKIERAEGSSTAKAQDIKSINYNKAVRSKVSHLRPKLESAAVDHRQPLNGSVKFQNIHHSFSGKIIRGKAAKESNLILSKMQKMFDCWDIIMNSFHCSLVPASRETGVREKEKPQNNRYFYFIGNGNNANLIRSILRKRSWWCETNSAGKANLVWSQLKMGEVLQKSKSYEEAWGDNFIPYEEDWQADPEADQLRKSCKKSSSSEFTRPPPTKRNCTARIFHARQDTRYHCVLEARQCLARLERVAAPAVLHNHYSHNFMLGNKNALYYNLAMYYQFSRKDLARIVPPTYYVEKGNQRSLEEFERAFQDSKRRNSVWIVKPAENSNRGQGIFVTSSLGDIRAALGQQQKLIVQGYIRNLLLYNGRKFDIRTYMLAVTMHGRLKVYWYDEGYIRTSSEPYDLTNLLDPFIHLTNDAIQKNGENYGRYEEGNKLTYSQFERYLELKFYRQNVHIYSIHEEMGEMAREAVRSMYCRLEGEKKQFSFELFGLDFMIDSSFKPLLIEINTNPCLELSSSGLERLIPRMIENAFRLCVDPLFRPNIDYSFTKSESYYMYDETFLERNKFGLIFDERYDRNFQWQERCRRMKGIEWGEGEQDEYENEGDIISVEY